MGIHSIWKFFTPQIDKNSHKRMFYYPTEYDRYKEFRDSRFIYDLTSLPSMPLHR